MSRVTEFGHSAVGFCIWALARDGMTVPALDRHPDGDGLLRGCGFTSGNWLRWVAAVASAVEREDQLVDSTRLLSTIPRGVAQNARDPIRYAPIIVRRCLVAYRRAYSTSAIERAGRMTGLLGQLSAADQRALMAGLDERQVSHLRVHLAAYPEPVALWLPSGSAVVGVPSADPTNAMAAYKALLDAIGSPNEVAR